MPKNRDMPAGHTARSRSRPASNRSTQDVVQPIPAARSKESELAIQLKLDPHVTALEFRTFLSFSGHDVPIQMLVANLADGGRVAFDIIDTRPYRDLDAEGLLLLALQSHHIRLVEVDRSTIDAEPRASNSRRVWSHRELHVPTDLRAAIDRALATHERLTIRSLGNIVGLRDPVPTICALVSQGAIAIDLSGPLDSNSVVARRSDLWRSATKSSRFGRANP